MRKINYIVVHCSATREGCTLTSEALEAEHRRRGFRTTGYHYYIRRDGTVLGTRSLELPGAHCRGHNKYSIGICYEGGLDARGNPKDTRTPEQRSALHLLVYQLLSRAGPLGNLGILFTPTAMVIAQTLLIVSKRGLALGRSAL